MAYKKPAAVAHAKTFLILLLIPIIAAAVGMLVPLTIPASTTSV